MWKSCAVCTSQFEAKRAAAKYCGQTCRQRAHRRPEAASESMVVETQDEAAGEPATGLVTAATSTELETAGRLDSALGQAALALARRIDRGDAETGSSLAALVRQHRETLADAVHDAQRDADPLDELRSRRERKRGAG
jgi:hypothetical protein